MQTRLGSVIEAVVNVVIGFGINYAANLFVLPLFGFNVSPGAAFGIGVIFTVISLVRSYLLRRYFNLAHVNAAIEARVVLAFARIKAWTG